MGLGQFIHWDWTIYGNPHLWKPFLALAQEDAEEVRMRRRALPGRCPGLLRHRAAADDRAAGAVA